MKKKRRIKKKEKYALVFLSVLGVIFLLQKLTKPTWKDGNTQSIQADERGAHEQQNNYSGVNDAEGINIME